MCFFSHSCFLLLYLSVSTSLWLFFSLLITVSVCLLHRSYSFLHISPPLFLTLHFIPHYEPYHVLISLIWCSPLLTSKFIVCHLPKQIKPSKCYFLEMWHCLHISYSLIISMPSKTHLKLILKNTNNLITLLNVTFSKSQMTMFWCLNSLSIAIAFKMINDY